MESHLMAGSRKERNQGHHHAKIVMRFEAKREQIIRPLKFLVLAKGL